MVSKASKFLTKRFNKQVENVKGWKEVGRKEREKEKMREEGRRKEGILRAFPYIFLDRMELHCHF